MIGYWNDDEDAALLTLNYSRAMPDDMVLVTPIPKRFPRTSFGYFCVRILHSLALLGLDVELWADGHSRETMAHDFGRVTNIRPPLARNKGQNSSKGVPSCTHKPPLRPQRPIAPSAHSQPRQITSTIQSFLWSVFASTISRLKTPRLASL